MGSAMTAPSNRARHLHRIAPILLGLMLSCFMPAPATAQKTEVDLELVLLVDVSRSMSEEELELQRRGYAEALRSEDVFQAVQSGLLQTLALTYVEWAGSQEVIVDWQLIEGRDDLNAFADRLTARFNPSMRRTSISGALGFAAGLIEGNADRGLRRVIDISGDGPNNLGPLVTRARDETIAKGITINGLPLMTAEGSIMFFHLDRLDIYYQSCVIGGSGAFVIPVYVWSDFATAVRRKLVLEIASHAPAPRIIKAQAPARDPSDCRIGEKIWREWQQNRQFFYDP
jgi:hypothetical protein